MSAPEPQVRVLYRPGESLTPGYPWAHECEGCDETSGYWATREDCERYATEHENTCAAIQLARLQARWDAHNEALRALRDEWRTNVTKPTCEDSCCRPWRECADAIDVLLRGAQ